MPDLLPNGGMYGKFARALKCDKDMQDTLKGLIGHEAKAEFRKKWALEKSKVCMTV